MWNWKRIAGTCLLFTGVLFGLAGGDISLSLAPTRPFVGRNAVLTVTANAGNVQIRRLPEVDGIRWTGGVSRRSSMTRMIFSSGPAGAEAEISSQVSVNFTAEKEGRFTIPPFEVLLDGKPAKTPSFTFEVKAKPDFGKTLSGQEKRKRIFALLRIPEMEGRSSCFVGEELSLEFLVFISSKIPYEVKFLSPPAFLVEKGGASVRLRDHRNKNPRAPNYEGYDTFLQEIDDYEYTVHRITTRFRPISPGPLKLSAEWALEFVEGMSLFARHTDPIPVTASLTESITVKALPSLPADMPPFCGLVGSDWTVRGELHPGGSCTGDPATLKIQVEGSGSTEAFRMPAPEFPDFRCYPPEIQRRNDGVCTVSCTMIPLKAGTFDIRTGLSTFDPDSGTYKPFYFQQTMTVKKAETILPGASSGRVYVDASVVPADETTEPEAAAGSSSGPRDILYLHRDTSDRVLLPLWKNSLTAIIGVLFFGLLFFAISTYRAVHKAAQRGDPSFLRRKNAGKEKQPLIRALQSASPEELPGLISRVSDYLNDTLDLPSGASLSEAAAHFDKGKSVPFARALKELSDRAWMPGADSSLPPQVRTELIRGLSRFTILLFSAALLCLHSTSPLSAAEPSPSGDAAMTAYDSGDFARALDIYSAELKTGTGVSPSLLYNIGNCYYQMGELPRALVCYERAVRLAPRNSDIQENLDLARRKLLLREKFRIERPSDLVVRVRDILRFDEWILAAAIGLALFLIALGLRPRFRLGWRVTAGLGALLVAGALTAALVQRSALYSGHQAIVVRRNAPVYSLPSETVTTVHSRLKEGREINVEEKRLGWARIRSGSEEGWVRESDILPLWGKNMTDLIPDGEKPQDGSVKVVMQ